MTDPQGAERRVLLGHVSAAHGIRGEVLIKTHTAEPAAIAAYGALTDAPGTRQFEIKVVRVTAKGVIVRIKGVADRTAAEKLRGTELYAARARLPATHEREFYHSDLIGLAAVDADGRAVGKVVAVQNFGAGDLIELQLAGARGTELLPFTDAFVPEVDLANGRIVVAIPVTAEEEPDEDGAGAEDTGQ